MVAHYCGGSLEDVALFSEPSSCCDGEDVKNNDCCTNDSKHVSFQKDFTFSTLVSDYKMPVQHLFIIDHSLFYQFENNSVIELLALDNNKNHPPNLVQQDIVLNSVLRI